MDIRPLTLDLLGRRFKTNRNQQAGSGAILEKSREYMIVEVFKYNVLCTTEYENGITVRESFSANELIQMGIIK